MASVSSATMTLQLKGTPMGSPGSFAELDLIQAHRCILTWRTAGPLTDPKTNNWSDYVRLQERVLPTSHLCVSCSWYRVWAE